MRVVRRDDTFQQIMGSDVDLIDPGLKVYDRDQDCGRRIIVGWRDCAPMRGPPGSHEQMTKILDLR